MPKRALVLAKVNLQEKKIKLDNEVLTRGEKLKQTLMGAVYIERALTKTSYSIHASMYHDVIPAFNAGLVPENSLDLWLPYPTYKFSSPYPIYVAKFHTSPLDICYKRPMDYFNFRGRLQHARTSFQKAKKSRQKRYIQKETIYPICVYELAERIEQQNQIDPYFHSSYDFYYTGGNLCILPQIDKILHVSGVDLQELSASAFSNNDTLFNGFGYLENICVKTLNNSGEIFEIQNTSAPSKYSSNYDNTTNYFLTRQQNVITLFECDAEYKRLKKLLHFKCQKAPFISVAASLTTGAHGIPDEVLISTMKQHVRQYDITTNVPTLVKRFELSNEHLWNIIRPWSEHIYLYANEKQFNLIDVRTTPDQWLDTITLNDQNSSICEQISALTRSNYSNLFYMATSHHLHCMDVRYLKTVNNDEFGIYRWTHQCEYPPLLIDTLRIHNKREYIALSSPLSGDMTVCELSRSRNTNKEGIPTTKFLYKSKQLPYQPPTLQEAYDYARLKGKCLQPEANLQQRIRCCTTGLKFYNRPIGRNRENESLELPLLLYANSIGDIYVHTITKDSMYMDEDNRIRISSSLIMDDYAEKVKDLQPPPLNYTTVVDFKVMRKIFCCAYLSKKSDVLDIDNMSDSYDEDETRRSEAKPQRKKRNYQRLGRWQKSITKLHSYKDALAQDMLSIWDIDTDESNVNTNFDKELEYSAQSSYANKVEAKINDWFNKYNIEPTSNLPQDDFIVPSCNDYFKENCLNDLSQQFDNCVDIIHSTQIHSNTELNKDISINKTLNDSALNSTILSTKSQKRKRKTTTYVKGF